MRRLLDEIGERKNARSLNDPRICEGQATGFIPVVALSATVPRVPRTVAAAVSHMAELGIVVCDDKGSVVGSRGLTLNFAGSKQP